MDHVVSHDDSNFYSQQYPSLYVSIKLYNELFYYYYYFNNEERKA